MSAKRHHYLPECYLRQFASKNFVNVFDRDLKEVRTQNVLNTGVVGHLYSIHLGDGKKDPSIEEMLAKIDGRIPIITQELEKRESITNEIRTELAILAALMLVRVPNYRVGVERVAKKLGKKFLESSYSSVEALRASVEEWQREDPSASQDVDVEAMYTALQTYELRVHPNHALSSMVNLIEPLAENFSRLDTLVFHAPADSAFLTCDRPLVTMPRLKKGYPIGGAGIISPGARKFLPLSNSLAVVFADQGTQFVHADVSRTEVKGVNAVITQFTDRFLIGRDKLQVEWWARRGRLAESEPIGGMDLI